LAGNCTHTSGRPPSTEHRDAVISSPARGSERPIWCPEAKRFEKDTRGRAGPHPVRMTGSTLAFDRRGGMSYQTAHASFQTPTKAPLSSRSEVRNGGNGEGLPRPLRYLVTGEDPVIPSTCNCRCNESSRWSTGTPSPPAWVLHPRTSPGHAYAPGYMWGKAPPGGGMLASRRKCQPAAHRRKSGGGPDISID